MSFVNLYSLPAKILYSEEFSENGKNVIYSVGISDAGAWVLKTNSNGVKIWERNYSIPDVANLTFHKIIRSDAGGIFYVLYATGDNYDHLIKINLKGDILVVKKLKTLNSGIGFLQPSKIDSSIYFIYAGRKSTDPFDSLDRLIASKFDSNLVLQDAIFTISVGDDYTTVLSVLSHQYGLTILLQEKGFAVHMVELDHQMRILSNNVLFHDFNNVDPTKVANDIVLISYDPGNIANNKYAVSLYDITAECIILAIIDINFGNWIYHFPNTPNSESTMLRDGTSIYVNIITTDSGSELHKLDISNLENIIISWSKTFSKLNVHYSLKRFQLGRESSNLLAWSVKGSLLFNSQRDAQTCITKIVSRQITKIKRLEIFATHENFISHTFPIIDSSADFEIADTAVESICDPTDTYFQLNDEASLQSSHFYLQAAGSTGLDSTAGFHLRWALKGALESHLPKGNLARNFVNFNKPEDYVRIYSAPYNARKVLLDLESVPNLILDNTSTWIYQVGTDIFHIYFRNTSKYTQVRELVDPNIYPGKFITEYGEDVIEVESKYKLSFCITPTFNSDMGIFAIEILSVEENRISADRFVSYRKIAAIKKTFPKEILSENIRSIRFTSRPSIKNIAFEFYQDFINYASSKSHWLYLNSYALSLDQDEVFERLEPIAGSVHGKWARYNNRATVNIENYQNKWNDVDSELTDDIQAVVQDYIRLSDDVSNPLANQNYSLAGDDPQTTADYDPLNESFEISNLQLLNIAALDYHVARMLGLGTLVSSGKIPAGTIPIGDVTTPIGNPLDPQPQNTIAAFVFLAEYHTYKDLNDGLGVRHVQHVYCSLPTSQSDSRLPHMLSLKEPVPGVFYGTDTETQTQLTGDEGYSHDGQTRYLTLFHQELHDEPANAGFLQSNFEFDSSSRTQPVYAGLEYRAGSESEWRKPELAHDKKYHNIDTSAGLHEKYKNESVPIPIPEKGHPLFIHREKEDGLHYYSSYGINWFGRIDVRAAAEWPVETTFPIINNLLPPTNIFAQLIRQEQPLMFTSAYEQLRLDNIASVDKTLIRLTFEYNQGQELKDYHKEINGEEVSGYVDFPLDDEIFAEEINISFRQEIPLTVSGKATVLSGLGSDVYSIIESSPYFFLSAGSDGFTINLDQPDQQIIPEIPTGEENRFAGGVLVVDEKEFIINTVTAGVNGYPKFEVYNNTSRGSLLYSPLQAGDAIERPANGKLFITVENMLLETNWNSSLSFRVDLGAGNKGIHKEDVTIRLADGTTETHEQRFKGIYKSANVTKFLEDVGVYDYPNDQQPSEILPNQHQGIYRVEFPGLHLSQHPQFSEDGESVEWQNGVVRLQTFGQIDGPRKVFNVIRTLNIGKNDNLVLFILDPEFSDENPNDDQLNSIVTGTQIVSYYPGYKVYLEADLASDMIEENILPSPGEGFHYSIFSLRSYNIANNFNSKFSGPVLMFAQELEEALEPNPPVGGNYATRPDFYGKSTYTFTTEFKHKPHAVQFNRSSDIQILGSLYAPVTVNSINEHIFKFGEDLYYNNRWEQFLDFDGYGQYYESFGQDNGPLPFPDNSDFLASINAFIDEHNAYYNIVPPVGHVVTIVSLVQLVIPAVSGRNSELLVKDFIKDVVHNCFVPLTEVPVIFDFIKTETENYKPINKKQVVRDRNGNLLKPTDPDFDMAPMMVLLAKSENINNTVGLNTIQFTDFGIDGASNAKYFYTVREFSLQMKTSDYSTVIGPVNLVNVRPPNTPEIIKVMAILENRIQNIEAGMQLEINPYPSLQNIGRITIYRAMNKDDCATVRTMDIIKSIEVLPESYPDTLIKWIVQDDFSNFDEIPYGDPLYYRITVSRAVSYRDISGNIHNEFAPSEASKLIITNIAESYAPASPQLQYFSEEPEEGVINFVTFSWNKTAYKGKYYLYKMNSQGNWTKIYETTSNEPIVYARLEDTVYGQNSLQIVDIEGNKLYHHFKVISENTSGMQSSDENILTIYDADSWQSNGGIGDMIVGSTFIVRPD